MVDTTDTSELYGDPGRWYAVLCDEHGWVVPNPEARIEEETAAADPEEGYFADADAEYEVSVVRGTARPEWDGADGHRLPGHHKTEDVAQFFEGLEKAGKLAATWLDAQAIANRRNGTETRTEYAVRWPDLHGDRPRGDVKLEWGIEPFASADQAAALATQYPGACEVLTREITTTAWIVYGVDVAAPTVDARDHRPDGSDV
jgi:hypothetical protein